MRALVLTHHPSEGPGNIGSFLQSRGVSLDIIPLFAGGKIPPDALYYDSIISMGGPMNVYEEDVNPFLREETALLQKALRFKTPLLGICLGAQMIAKAAGARVVQSPEKELGWRKVGLTGLGKSDRLFLGLPTEFTVFQWHGDMFQIPVGGGLLASGDACPHQAFRFGSGYGLQFHVEVTRDMLADWFSGTPECEPITDEMNKIQGNLSIIADLLFKNFFSFMKTSSYTRGL